MASRTETKKALRIIAPCAGMSCPVFNRNVALYRCIATLHCDVTLYDSAWDQWDSACILRLTVSTWLNTRRMLPPRIFLISSALYPRSSRACVIFGRSAAESMPAGGAPEKPGKHGHRAQ